MRKPIIILICGLAVCLIVFFWGVGRNKPAPAETLKHDTQKPAIAKPPVEKSSTSAQGKTAAILRTAGIELENINAEAGVVLQQAVQSACFSEIARRRFLDGSNPWGPGAAEALARHLFKDDFAFAANLDPRGLDCGQAGTVFAAIAQQLHDLPMDEIQTAMGELPQEKLRASSVPAGGETVIPSGPIGDTYKRWLHTAAPGFAPQFSNIAGVLKEKVPYKNAMASDLFKDVCFFLAEQASLQEIAANMRKNEKLVGQDSGGDRYVGLPDTTTPKFRQIMESHASVAEFRLQHLFGITNAPELMADLTKLHLNPTPTEVPCP